MNKFEWEDKYEIGCGTIDDQHRRLFGLANSVVEAVNSSDHEGLDNAVMELLDYTVYHFASEERYMEEHGCPTLPDHHNEHEVLAETLRSRIVESCGHEELGELIVELMDMWIVQHILDEDQEIGRFMQRLSGT